MQSLKSFDIDLTPGQHHSFDYFRSWIGHKKTLYIKNVEIYLIYGEYIACVDYFCVLDCRVEPLVSVVAVTGVYMQ